jgi:Uma2 family endonuclease
VATLRQTQPQLDHLLLELRPDQGTWSDEDYLWSTDHTSRLLELTDGYLEVLPRPTDEHQNLLGFLFECLLHWTRQHGGRVRVAPLRMQIRPGKFRDEPDLLLLTDSQRPPPREPLLERR